MKDTDIAWAAGVIDGKGCVFITHKAPQGKGVTASFSICLKVSMGHQPTVDRLHEIFGKGSLHNVIQTKYNPAWTWLVQSQQCLEVLLLIKPYSLTKQAEIEVAIEFMSLPKWVGGRWKGPMPADLFASKFALYERMRDLKPRSNIRQQRIESGTYNPPGRKRKDVLNGDREVC
jgi:hypothetical protein